MAGEGCEDPMVASSGETVSARAAVTAFWTSSDINCLNCPPSSGEAALLGSSGSAAEETGGSVTGLGAARRVLFLVPDMTRQ